MNFVNSESPQDERRRFERSRLIIDVFFDGEDLTGVASTQDISPGGPYMNTQAAIPEAAVLTLRVPVAWLAAGCYGEAVSSNPGAGAGDSRRLHAPHLTLERPEDFRRRALHSAHRGVADGRALPAHLRPARARRRRRPRPTGAHHERRALLPPARFGALDIVALLARRQHRAEVLPLRGLQKIPAHGHPRPLRLLRLFPALR